MKLPAMAALVGLTATIAAGVVAVEAPVAGASGLPPCVPKIGKINGHEAFTNCGPATATLKIAGKTYTFKGGYCEADPTAHLDLGLTLGVLIAGNSTTNAGKPLFQLNLVTEGKLAVDTVSAHYGGKVLETLGFVKIKGSTSSGTFTSASSALGGSSHFSGSWNCHGSLYKV